MGNLTSDWHIHSHNSCDCSSLTLSELMEKTTAAGIRDFGVTDHLHTPHNLPDIEACRREYDALKPPPNFHFGIELSCVSEWELREIAKGSHPDATYGVRQGGPPNSPLSIGATEDVLERLGVEFVVAGTHWPMYVPFERETVIRDYHRQNMFLATHPLVDIVAHPWWWWGHWADADDVFRGDPWLDNFGKIPRSMHREFAAACRESGTVVEANIGALILNYGYPETFRWRYIEYLAGLKADSVVLSIGSDCHNDYGAIEFDKAAGMLAKVGIVDDDFWRLPPRRP